MMYLDEFACLWPHNNRCGSFHGTIGGVNKAVPRRMLKQHSRHTAMRLLRIGSAAAAVARTGLTFDCCTHDRIHLIHFDNVHNAMELSMPSGYILLI